MKPAAFAVCLLPVAALWLSAEPARPEGLAARYPKDVGIGRDPAVLLHDDFERGPIGARWDEVTRRRNRGATEAGEPVQAETDRAIARGRARPGCSSARTGTRT